MTNRSSLRVRSGVLIAALVIALGACKGEDKAAESTGAGARLPKKGRPPTAAAATAGAALGASTGLGGLSTSRLQGRRQDGSRRGKRR